MTLIPLLAPLMAGALAAERVTLDNGATLTGALATWEAGGACRVYVSEGPLVDTIVELPCARVASFERAPVATAEAPPLAETSATLVAPAPLPATPVAPAPAVLPPAGPVVEAPFAQRPPAAPIATLESAPPAS